MDQNLAGRMFHALVVMGAALGGGCGPVPAPEKEGTSSGDPATTSSSTSTPIEPMTTTAPVTTSGAVTSTTTIDVETTTPVTSSSATEPATTGPDVIDGPEDCGFPQQFKCEVLDPPKNCFCDPDAPLVPGDCAHPEQFFCEVPWLSPPQGCFCKLDAPTAPEDCPVPNNFNCFQYEPERIQCSCECDPGPIHPQSQEDCPPSDFFFCEFEPVGCCCIFVQLG